MKRICKSLKAEKPRCNAGLALITANGCRAAGYSAQAAAPWLWGVSTRAAMLSIGQQAARPSATGSTLKWRELQGQACTWQLVLMDWVQQGCTARGRTSASRRPGAAPALGMTVGTDWLQCKSGAFCLANIDDPWRACKRGCWSWYSRTQAMLHVALLGNNQPQPAVNSNRGLFDLH